MNNPLIELGKDKLSLVNFSEELQDYLNSNQSSPYIIYACDARVLLLFAEASKYIYEPYLKASKILSDGRPVYWLAKSLTQTTFEQLTGPKFMLDVLSDVRLKRKRHMFYGGHSKTIDLLKKRCLENNVNLVYAEAPPFLSIEELDIAGVEEKIQEYEVDFFWCGLGAPKQEYLIYQLNSNRKVVMTGVGLAFDYYAGTVKRSPDVLSKLGLEWFVRYAQQPNRIGRFIRPFFFVLRLLLAIQIKRVKLS
jgi:N-acetylglucosaminyldiphosphoundecaprenol N-acetyl-beta-D-mannosaminyltransferase